MSRARAAASRRRKRTLVTAARVPRSAGGSGKSAVLVDDVPEERTKMVKIDTSARDKHEDAIAVRSLKAAGAWMAECG